MTEKKPKRTRGIFTSIAETVSSSFPTLKKKLIVADLKQTPEEFLEKVIKSTILISITLFVLTAIFLHILGAINFNEPKFDEMIYLIIPLILYPIVVFYYLMMYPDAAIVKRRKDIDYEIVFAGRHLVIALKSGMPLFDAMVGVSGRYGKVGEEFGKIVEKVSLGVPISQALRESSQTSPSKYFIRIIMQITNSLSSGADVGSSVDIVLEQITKEQMIALKEYGQKLTPIVMFFMVFGIILPSLGVVLATVLFSVISGGVIGVPPYVLILVFFMIAVIQFLFLGLVESSRPRYLV